MLQRSVFNRIMYTMMVQKHDTVSFVQGWNILAFPCLLLIEKGHHVYPINYICIEYILLSTGWF